MSDAGNPEGHPRAPGSDAGTIRFERDGGVGVVTIDRPERRNALSVDLCHQMRGHLEAHRDLRAVVITGVGSAFCAGADLVSRGASHPGGAGVSPGISEAPGPEGSGTGADRFHPAFEPLLAAIVDYPAPVVAAINGPALGGGTQLAVACDLRVAGPNAVFGIPATQLGVMILPENIKRLALLVGQAHARDILLTGRRFKVGEALRMGLVHRLSDDPRADGLAWAAEIAALAPFTVAGHKAALNALAEHTGYDRGADDGTVARLDALVAEAFNSEDAREGMAAFAEKRPPLFRGR